MKPKMYEQIGIRVEGKVHGVSFRFATLRTATSLGLVGWVCNRADGSVEMLAQGEKEATEKLLAWCAKGPALAKVTKVEILQRCEAENLTFADFKIT